MAKSIGEMLAAGKRCVPRADSFESWPGETCYVCGKRHPTGFQVDDDVWVAVVGNEGVVLCPACFDEMAQEKGIKYSVKEVCYVSWSDWNHG